MRNAQTAKHETVKIPYSKIKMGIVKILHEEGFLGSFKLNTLNSVKKEIEISIRYSDKQEPIISNLRRVSRPGRRQYTGYQDLKPIRSGLGIGILSTSKGIITDKQARHEKTGGELLCTIW
ncbi:MAG: 30S ribosomal protein S8 [Deltaproteobacteria bacterium]|nr:MAG: 30S ribosomal protein S8 [Deltaproteobacteria bacterium]